MKASEENTSENVQQATSKSQSVEFPSVVKVIWGM